MRARLARAVGGGGGGDGGAGGGGGVGSPASTPSSLGASVRGRLGMDTPPQPRLEPWFGAAGPHVTLTSAGEAMAGPGLDHYWKGQWVLCSGAGVRRGVWRVSFSLSRGAEVYFGVSVSQSVAKSATFESTAFCWVRASGALVYDRSVRAVRSLPPVNAGDTVVMELDMTHGLLSYRVNGGPRGTIADWLRGSRVWPAWFINNGAVVTLLDVEEVPAEDAAAATARHHHHTALVVTAPPDADAARDAE